MVEELSAIVNKCELFPLGAVDGGLMTLLSRHGSTLSSNVWGKIEANSKLSGMRLELAL